MMRHRAIWLITFLLIVFGAASAKGVVLYDNLSKDPTSLPRFVAQGDDTWLAQSFSTDGYSYSLETVTLRMDMTTAGAAQLEIYTDIPRVPPVLGELGTMPGSSLGTLTSPVIGTTLEGYTFTSSGLSLNPNSTYWVVLKALSGGAFEWAWTESNMGYGNGFDTRWGIRQYSSSSSSWVWGGGPTEPFIMQVVVASEPSTLALFGAVTLLGISYLRQPRRRG